MASIAAELPAFYAREGLPDHGGQVGWVDWVTVFGARVPIPNIPARKRVLDYHDAHHLVTGYRTDAVGEAEIGAWTLAAGDQGALATSYDLAAFALGLVQAPRRTTRAFYRGRRCRTLYGLDRAALLAAELDELRAHARTDQPPAPPTARDHAALAGWIGAAVALPVLFPPLFLAACVRG